MKTTYLLSALIIGVIVCAPYTSNNLDVYATPTGHTEKLLLDVIRSNETEPLAERVDCEFVYRVTGSQAAVNVIFKESSCNNFAKNPTSTATGLAQFLDSTWATVGCAKTYDAIEQLRCAQLYVDQRYGSWEAAYEFQLLNNYY